MKLWEICDIVPRIDRRWWVVTLCRLKPSATLRIPISKYGWWFHYLRGYFAQVKNHCFAVGNGNLTLWTTSPHSIHPPLNLHS